MSQERINYNDGSYIEYNLEHDDVLCQYIRQVDMIIKSNNRSLLNTLDTIINNYVSDIRLIRNTLNNALNVLDRCNSMVQVIKVAKDLSNNHNNYNKIIHTYMQIETLSIVNYDDAIGINDKIEHDAHILKSTIENTNLEFQKFFDICNNRFHKLDSSQKLILKRILIQYSTSINNFNNSDPVIEVTHEGNAVLNVISVITGIISKIIWTFKAVGLIAVGGFSILLLTDNEGALRFLDETVGEVFTQTATIVTVIFLLYVVVCGAYYLYKYINNRNNQSENSSINDKLNTIKSKVFDDSNRGLTTSLLQTSSIDNTPTEEDDKLPSSINNEIPKFDTPPIPNSNSTIPLDSKADKDPNEDKVFRGFGNTKGYRPDSKNKQNDKFDIFS